MTPTQPTSETTTVRQERVFACPPERLYDAWLDPVKVARWLAPGDFEVAHAEIDARPGGHYRIWHSSDGTPVGGFETEIVELLPPRRLVFNWGFCGPDRDAGPRYDSKLTITLTEMPDGGTRLLLVHEQLDALAAALPDVARKVDVGWELVLTKLTSLVDATGQAERQR